MRRPPSAIATHSCENEMLRCLPGMPLEELIRKAADPLKAKKMGEVKDIPPRNDWKENQEEVM